MGWTGEYTHHETCRGFILDKFANDDDGVWHQDWKMIDHSVQSNVGYFLLQHKHNENDRVINVISCHKGDRQGGQTEFVHRCYGESDSPSYYTCPKRLLQQSTSTHEDAVAWRKAHYEIAKREKELKAILKDIENRIPTGILLQSEHKGMLRYIQPYKIKGWFVAFNENGERYRYQLSQLKIDVLRELQAQITKTAKPA